MTVVVDNLFMGTYHADTGTDDVYGMRYDTSCYPGTKTLVSYKLLATYGPVQGSMQCMVPRKRSKDDEDARSRGEAYRPQGEFSFAPRKGPRETIVPIGRRRRCCVERLALV